IGLGERREAGVGPRPAEELLLPSVQQIRLLRGGAVLDSRGQAFEVVVAIGAAAVAACAGVRELHTQPAAAGKLERACRTQIEQAQVVIARAGQYLAAALHGYRLVAYRGDGGIESVDRVVDAGRDVRRRQHARMERQLHRVMPRLRIEQRQRHHAEPGALEQATAYRYVGLAFRETAWLHVHSRI